MANITRREVIVGAGGALLSPALPALAEAPMRMRALYNPDMSFSPLAAARNGQTVLFNGFMAPPLRAISRFFVLTKRPMAVCPFCESEADWPDDIIAVYTKRIVTMVPFNVRIQVRGTLILGAYTDPATKFVSRLRLTKASFYRI